MSQVVSVRRAAAMAMHGGLIPSQRRHPDTTVGELTPDEIGKRVAVRSGDFLGTVFGTLLDVHAHPRLPQITLVQLYGKKLLAFRNDIPVQVVDAG